MGSENVVIQKNRLSFRHKEKLNNAITAKWVQWESIELS